MTPIKSVAVLVPNSSRLNFTDSTRLPAARWEEDDRCFAAGADNSPPARLHECPAPVHREARRTNPTRERALRSITPLGDAAASEIQNHGDAIPDRWVCHCGASGLALMGR